MYAIWSGSIAFGLVNIPVKLLGALETDDIKFHSLAKNDLSQIRYKRVSEATGEEVPYQDIVKGYEYEKGRFVVIEDADIEKVSPVRSKTIDIVQFSKQAEVDPLLFEKPYYLVPAKGGEKTYKLLQQALEKTDLVGIAEFILRNREHICLVRSYQGRLVLSQLRYQQELRALPEEIDKGVNVTDKELQLALQLVKQLTEQFDASKFTDRYVDEMKKVIEAKASGKKLKAVPQGKAAPSNVKDLMDTLKASLGTPKKGGRKAA